MITPAAEMEILRLPSRTVKRRATQLLEEALEARSEWQFGRSSELSAKAHKVAFIAGDYDTCVTCLVLQAENYCQLNDFDNYDMTVDAAVAFARQHAVSPSAYILVLLKMSSNLCEKMHFDEAISYADKALRLARKENDWESELSSLMTLAHIHEHNGNYEASLVFCRTAANVIKHKRDPASKAEVLYQTARVLVAQKQYSAALDVLEEAQVSLKKYDDAVVLSDIKYLEFLIYSDVGDIGKVHEAFRDYAYVQSAFKEVENFSTQIGDRFLMPGVVSQHPHAIPRLEAIRASLEGTDHHARFPLLYAYLGGAYSRAKELKKAIEYYWKAAELLTQTLLEDHAKFFFVLQQLSTCLRLTENDKSADELEFLASKGKRLFEKTESVEDAISEKRQEYIHGLPANLHAIRYYLSRYFKWDKIVIDLENGQIRRNKKLVKKKVRKKSVPVKLSFRQIKVLRKLIERMPSPVTFDEVVEAADGRPPAAGVATRDRAAHYYKEICKRVGVNFILSEWGIGYYIPNETASLSS